MSSRFFGTLLITGALIGCYFLYQDYWAKEFKDRNPWIARLTPLIKPHLLNSGESKDWGMASDASFMMILQMAWQAGEDGYSPQAAVRGAAIQAGAPTGEADAIANAVSENLQFANKMEVFSDLKNPINMERGEAPIAVAKDWADEPLVVGHRLPVALAPELAHALPNLRLMPSFARNMVTDQIGKDEVILAKRWLQLKFLRPESMGRLLEKVKEVQSF